jgi:hypothetical protein
MTETDNSTPISWLSADWPAPEHVHAGTTLRHGGHSQGAYGAFNLAMHVGDSEQLVLANRQQLKAALNLSTEPAWLQQTHSKIVMRAEQVVDHVPEADASFTTQAGMTCVVMTADCLPLLVTDRQGSCVAAIHAGWRGLVNGIIEQTLSAMPVENNQLLVWLGPAIGPQAYEVGDDVRQMFIRHNKQAHQAFKQVDESHWLMDIYQLARQVLNRLNVEHIYGGEYCTFSETEKFYSYRRDKQTGRMASLIWFEK